jgi:ATP-dependent RNA helicase HelY
MSEGLLDAVFATSTVAAGVNFPARTILFLNSDRFNGQEFAPLTATEFHQMTGRAGRRGKDKIGFAVAVPGRFMDAHLAARLVSAPPTDVGSQIRINFSMVLNLLLSHTPEQVEDLLKRSFATFPADPLAGPPGPAPGAGPVPSPPVGRFPPPPGFSAGPRVRRRRRPPDGRR